MKLLISILAFTVLLYLPTEGSANPTSQADSLLNQLNQFDSLQDPNGYVNLRLALASIYVLEKWDKADRHLRKALKFADNISDDHLQARIMVNYGRLLLDHNDFSRSLHFLSEALRILRQETRDPGLLGWLEINIGNLLYKLQNYSEASEFYFDAILSFEIDSMDIGKAVAYNNIGLCALRLKKPEVALSYFQKAYTLRQKINNPLLLAHSNIYLAQAYERLNQEKKADSLLQYSTGFFLQHKEWDLLHKSIIETAKLEKKRGNFKKALYILENNANTTGLFYRKFEMEEYLLRGQLQRLMGDYEAAEERLLEGIQRARQYEQYINSQDLYEELLLVYEDQGKLKASLDAARIIISLNDSLEISRNRALYEILRTQNELSHQKKQNQHLEEINEESQAEIKERNDWLIASVLVITILLGLMLEVYLQSRKIKRTEKRLRESNQQVMAIINNTDNFILSLNAQGEIILINKACADFYQNMTGHRYKQGEYFLAYLRDVDQEDWEKRMDKASKGEIWQEVSQFPGEAEAMHLIKSFSPLTSEDTLQALVMVGADITENRKKSLEIERQKEDLHQANIAKERMLSILAHDLKDSIFSATSLTNLVLERKAEHSREDLIEYIILLNRNFTKTKSLLTGLLEWVKTQSHGMKARLETTDLKTLTNQVLEGMSLKLEKKDVQLIDRLPERVMVKADEEMIRTVLRNLLSNAIKYTFSRTGIIEIFVEDHGQHFQVHIKDNGQGISDDDQLRLFDVPGRISTPGTANEQGTGFGLSLCHELLKLHRSRLLVNSRKGEGSDFYFNLEKA